MGRKSNGGRIFPGGGDEGGEGGEDSPSRENPVISYIKARKKKYFYNLENLKN